MIFNIKRIKCTNAVSTKRYCRLSTIHTRRLRLTKQWLLLINLIFPLDTCFYRPPPVESLPIPDLRTQGSRPVEQPSAELLDLIHVFQSSYGFFEHAVFTCKINSNKTLTRLTVNRTTIYDYPNFIAQ